jgi:hypothetical protein
LVELQHVNVKLLLRDAGEPDLEPLIPVFHGWIRDQALGGELLLDIADYRHVRAGPGVILIGHEGDYSVDHSDNRLGFRYNRKAAVPGSNQDRLLQAMRAALVACQRMEAEPQLNGKIKFGGQEIDIFFNDRLLVPNTAATRQSVEPELDMFFSRLFRGGYSISYASAADPRKLFGAGVKASRAVTVTNLLSNLDS